MIREFAAGVGTLGRGFSMWRTHPRLLALGLVPAAIAVLLLAALLIPFGLSLGGITDAITPFADGWITGWRTALRIALGVVLFVAAAVLSGLVFTALALTIGDPFYQRIWRGVERALGGAEPTGETGFWHTVGEGLRLVVLGVLVALLTLVLGFIPLVGGVLATVTGVALSGRLLARELTGRAFDARGLSVHWSQIAAMAVSNAPFATSEQSLGGLPRLAQGDVADTDPSRPASVRWSQIATMVASEAPFATSEQSLDGRSGLAQGTVVDRSRPDA